MRTRGLLLAVASCPDAPTSATADTVRASDSALPAASPRPAAAHEHKGFLRHTRSAPWRLRHVRITQQKGGGGGGAAPHTAAHARSPQAALLPNRCAYSAVPVGWGTMILAAREGSTKGTCSWTASWLQPQRTAHEQQRSRGSPPAGLQLVPRMAHPQRRPLHIHLCILGKMGARFTLLALRRRRPPLCSTHQSGQHKGGATHVAALHSLHGLGPAGWGMPARLGV